MKIILAKPRGFCAGVDRAIAIVEWALDQLGAPVYVKHEVVHNRFVVENLRERGAKFIEDIDDVPDNVPLIFSAHGVSKAIRNAAAKRLIQVFDATCPLVTKVHMEVARYSRQGIECILIGHAGHPEVEGTLGQYHNLDAGIYLVENLDDVARVAINDPKRLGVVTQTTLSVDDTQKIIHALKERFPAMQLPKRDDICYATQNRQDAVKALAKQADVILVVGSVESSNSNRLQELAEREGCRAYLIDGAMDLKREWFERVDAVGVTAGASAPEVLVQTVITQLQAWGGVSVEILQGIEENMMFALPKMIRESMPS